MKGNWRKLMKIWTITNVNSKKADFLLVRKLEGSINNQFLTIVIV